MLQRFTLQYRTIKNIKLILLLQFSHTNHTYKTNHKVLDDYRVSTITITNNINEYYYSRIILLKNIQIYKHTRKIYYI